MAKTTLYGGGEGGQFAHVSRCPIVALILENRPICLKSFVRGCSIILVPYAPRLFQGSEYKDGPLSEVNSCRGKRKKESPEINLLVFCACTILIQQVSPRTPLNSTEKRASDTLRSY